jgi:putative aldouronate transport system substrate-binding protein
MASPAINRRTLLKGAAGVAGIAALSPIIQACQPGPSTGPAASAGPKGVKLPTYVPMAGLPAPQLAASADGMIYPAYTKYPKDALVQTVKTPPGKGGVVTGLSYAGSKSGSGDFPPLEQNRALQNYNKLLGAEYRITRAADVPSEWASRVALIMSGDPSDHPDFLSHDYYDYIKGFDRFLESAYTDLTPYLSGDNVKEFPALAHQPTFSWKNTVINGKIMAVHQGASGIWGPVAAINEKLWMDAGGIPTNTDDFIRLAKLITKPADGIYAIVDPLVGTGVVRGVTPWIVGLFGGPNQWAVRDGKLVKDIETQEYRAALEFTRKLFEAGVVHPDSVNVSSNGSLNRGVSGLYAGPPIESWMYSWIRAGGRIPFRLMLPFGYDGKIKPTHHLLRGTSQRVSIKKGSEARVRELLAIANFLESPFGTTEFHNFFFGVDGVHYKYDAQGHPIRTADGLKEVQLDFVISPVKPIYSPIQPEDVAKQIHDAMEKLLPIAIQDPTLGLTSTTDFNEGAVLGNLQKDVQWEIVNGRLPVSAFDQLIKDWRAKGGDRIRGEYEEALAKQN